MASTNKRLFPPTDDATTKRLKSDPTLRCLKASEGITTNDEVHSSIDICPVTRAIIDTPAFQRLREVKQLARADFVFINCNHTRFEHSIGVSHLAERLARRIQEQQPVLGTTAKDVLCVKLAGLLHDIGHGPFSHVYETFVKHVQPKYLQNHPELKAYYEGYPALPKDWRHETVSLMMIDNVLESLALCIDYSRLDEPLQLVGKGIIDPRSLRVFQKGGSPLEPAQQDAATSTPDNDLSIILTSRDWIFIKECIWGGPIPEVKRELGMDCLIGRQEPAKEWLYDIVSNSRSGLDVDKIDYFARDQRRAFRSAGEIETRMINAALVTWVRCSRPDCKRCLRLMSSPHRNYKPRHHLNICYPQKMGRVCLSFFKTRHHLHDVIYRHKTVCSSVFLMEDILCRADPFFRISATSSRPFTARKPKYESLPISRAMLDPYAFLELTDTIMDLINRDPDKRLGPAQTLIRELYKPRKLYKCVGSVALSRKSPIDRRIWDKSTEEIAHEIYLIKGEHNNGDSKISLDKDDFVIEKCAVHHGSKDNNPLDGIQFLPKTKLSLLAESSSGPKARLTDLPVAQEASDLGDDDYPRSFQKTTLRVFCRDRNPKKMSLVAHHFETWLCEMREEAEMTPDVADEDSIGQHEMLEVSQESDTEDAYYRQQPAIFHSPPIVRYKTDQEF